MGGGTFGKLAKGSVGDAFEIPEVEGAGGSADDQSRMRLEACETKDSELLTRTDQTLSSMYLNLLGFRWTAGFRATQWV